MRNTPASKIVLTISLALGVAVAFYSISYLITSIPSSTPYAAAAGIGLVVVLILVGLLDANRAGSSILVSSVSLLPRLYEWGLHSPQRAILLSATVMAAASAVFCIGPARVENIKLDCGAAQTIGFSIKSEPVQCEGIFSQDMWIAPLIDLSEISALCYDENNKHWDAVGDLESGFRCSERPIAARFVSNGIEQPNWDVNTVTGSRARNGLARLRAGLEQELPYLQTQDRLIPKRSLDDYLLIATWNVRRLGNPRRLEEAHAYIAEIISNFDIVAVQELTDRQGLEKVMKLLGPHYDSEFGVISNEQRRVGGVSGFIFDTRKVQIGTISTTLVITRQRLEHTDSGQPIRPPYLAQFVVNDRRFLIANLHVFFGNNRGARRQARLQETQALALALRNDVMRIDPSQPLLIAGDLQSRDAQSPELQAYLDNGFSTDLELMNSPTNFRESHAYDQILLSEDHKLKMTLDEHGVFNPLQYVFREDDLELYAAEMRRSSARRNTEPTARSYNYWRLFQMSDHLPKWAAFRVDWTQ